MTVLYKNFYRLSQVLADDDRFSRRKFSGDSHESSDTIFLHYPPARYVVNPWHGYAACRRYFWFHKRGQRNVLDQYFNIPQRADDGEPPYIVRPVRHFGGREFHVAESERELRRCQRRIDGDSYAMELFRRTREFRAFFVGGEHVTTMLKSLDGYGYADSDNFPPVDDDDLQAQPWNRDQMGTSYLTITRSVNDKLANTSFYDDAEAFFDQYPFDLLAVDAAYNDHDDTYTVFETNFAPECTVQTTINPMKDQLAVLRSSSE